MSDLTVSGCLLFLAGLAALAGLVYRGWHSLLPEPSLQELMLRKERLEYSVTFWRYPDGGYVPQHKRMPLMRELRVVSRKLDALHAEQTSKPLAGETD